MNKFGKYLSIKLKEKGMTQSQLSQYSGVSDAHISRLSKEERGLPKIDTLQKIATALRMSLSEILSDLGFLDKQLEDLPENLQVFLRTYPSAQGIQQEEIEILATHSYFEGEETSTEGYAKLLGEIRNRPESRILSLMSEQPLEVRENCAKMIETYIRIFGEK